MTDIQLPNINNNPSILSNERENCENKMKKLCDEIAEDFFKLRKSFNMSNQILQSNYKVDENGNKLAEEGYAYDPDAQKFITHLQKVKENYKKLHQ